MLMILIIIVTITIIIIAISMFLLFVASAATRNRTRHCAVNLCNVAVQAGCAVRLRAMWLRSVMFVTKC